MLLAFYNNRPINIVGFGGAEISGAQNNSLIESNIGWKCKRLPIYVKAQYIEAGSNFKRRDYTGRPKSRALVAAITLCNQNIDILF